MALIMIKNGRILDPREGRDETGTLWLEDDGEPVTITAAPRVGIGYASPEDQARPWRYILSGQETPL